LKLIEPYTIPFKPPTPAKKKKEQIPKASPV